VLFKFTPYQPLLPLEVYRTRRSGVGGLKYETSILPIATIQKLQNFALQPMEISQRYNSVPVKDHCALFAPAPYFWARAIRWCHLNFSPADPCCHGNEVWDKIDYNSPPVKDNTPCLHLPPLYAAARLYSVATGQILRSTERISSYCHKI